MDARLPATYITRQCAKWCCGWVHNSELPPRAQLSPHSVPSSAQHQPSPPHIPLCRLSSVHVTPATAFVNLIFKSVPSVSLFRLGKRVVHNQPFHDVHGGRVNGSLELKVADFVSIDAETAIRRVALEMLTSTVPFGDLYSALIRGERQQRLEEKTPSPQAAVQASKKRVHFGLDWELPPEASGSSAGLDLDPGGVGMWEHHLNGTCEEAQN